MTENSAVTPSAMIVQMKKRLRWTWRSRRRHPSPSRHFLRANPALRAQGCPYPEYSPQFERMIAFVQGVRSQLRLSEFRTRAKLRDDEVTSREVGQCDSLVHRRKPRVPRSTCNCGHPRLHPRRVRLIAERGPVSVFRAQETRCGAAGPPAESIESNQRETPFSGQPSTASEACRGVHVSAHILQFLGIHAQEPTPRSVDGRHRDC